MKIIDNIKGKIPAVPEDDQVKPKSDDNLALELERAIDEHIESTIKGKFKKSTGFSPSTTNDCPRYWVYIFRGIYIPPNHGARVQRIFDNGHATHDRIYSYLESMGILRGKEIEIRFSTVDEKQRAVPFTAFADGIIGWDGEKLIELKSISEAGFAQVKLFRKPKDDHYKQTQLYLHLFDMTEGYVIYENKNTQDILVCRVQRNDEFLKKLLLKYGAIWEAFEDDKLPVRPYKSISSKQCKQCLVKKDCWADENEGIKISLT